MNEVTYFLSSIEGRTPSPKPPSEIDVDTKNIKSRMKPDALLVGR